MLFELPDDIVKHAEANKGDICLALAIQLYADNRIDYDDACKLSGLSSEALDRELIRRGITVIKYPAPSHRSLEAV